MNRWAMAAKAALVIRDPAVRSEARQPQIFGAHLPEPTGIRVGVGAVWLAAREVVAAAAAVAALARITRKAEDGGMTTVYLQAAVAAVGAAGPADKGGSKVVRHSRSSFTLRCSRTGASPPSSLAQGAKAEPGRSVVKEAPGAREPAEL
jgi:hypothetical protein